MEEFRGRVAAARHGHAAGRDLLYCHPAGQCIGDGDAGGVGRPHIGVGQRVGNQVAADNGRWGCALADHQVEADIGQIEGKATLFSADGGGHDVAANGVISGDR